MNFRRIASTLLVGTIIATALPLSASAAKAPRNSVTITIAGGDATAIATCLNVAKTGGDIDQTNTCDNIATAIGGDVTIQNSKIVAVVDADTGLGTKADQTTNTVDVTIVGGAAKAVAACVNVVAVKHHGKKNKASVDQTNDCANDAFAAGGNVTLKHSRIIAVVKH
jgi:hypothetical protein